MVIKILLSYYKYESKQESEGLNPGQQCSVQNLGRVNSKLLNYSHAILRFRLPSENPNGFIYIQVLSLATDGNV